PVSRLADHERRTNAHDAPCLAQNPLDATRISLVACDLPCAVRWLDLVESDNTTLDLRDRLLRDDDHVTVFQIGVLDDCRGQIVALVQLWDPANREDAKALLNALDEDERRILLVPEVWQHLERHEAE